VALPPVPLLEPPEPDEVPPDPEELPPVLPTIAPPFASPLDEQADNDERPMARNQPAQRATAKGLTLKMKPPPTIEAMRTAEPVSETGKVATHVG